MDLRDKPELAFSWDEPAPTLHTVQREDGQQYRTARYKMRFLCDPTVKPSVFGYKAGSEIVKDGWAPTAQWVFMVQEGRVTATNHDEKFCDDQMQTMLKKLKQAVPSLEGYATSSTNDFWVVTHYGVTRESYRPTLQNQAKREWIAKRKRCRFEESGDEEDY